MGCCLHRWRQVGAALAPGAGFESRNRLARRRECGRRPLSHLESAQGDISLRADDAAHLHQFIPQEGRQGIPVLAQHLDEQVELPRDHDQVAHFGEAGDGAGNLFQARLLHLDADHGGSVETELCRVDHADDLDHALLEQAVDPVADRAFRDAELPGDIGEGFAPVDLQLLDDLAIDSIEHHDYDFSNISTVYCEKRSMSSLRRGRGAAVCVPSRHRQEKPLIG